MLIDREFCTGDCWLLAGSGAVQRRLKEEISVNGGFDPGVRVLTLDEAAELLSRQPTDEPRLLTRGEPVALASKLLADHAGELPYFRRFSTQGETALEGVAGPVAQALRLLGQEGEIPANTVKLRDLARLIELRGEACRKLRVEEPFERQRRLARLLDAGELKPPPRAVLFLPAHLHPAELELVTALDRRLELRVIVEPEFATADENRPSTRHFAKTRVGLERLRAVRSEIAETRPEREGLVEWLFDGGDRPAEKPEYIRIWSAPDRRGEVVAVAREIKHRAAEGEPLGRFSIVVPKLEPYVALLAAELAERGIPFSLPGGEPLFASAPAQVLLALLKVLQRPGREELFAYWGHPALTPPKLPEPDEVYKTLAPQQQFLPPTPQGDPARFWSNNPPENRDLDPAAFDFLARKANVTGLPRGWEDRLDLNERLTQAWLRPVLNRLRLNALRGREEGEFLADEAAVKETRLRIYQLAAVIRELKRLEELRDSKLEVEALVGKIREELERRDFTQNLQRRLLDQLRDSTGDPAWAVIERRRAEAVSRAGLELGKALDAVVGVARFSDRKLKRPLTGLDALRRLVEGELAARSVRIPGPDDAVTVRELGRTHGWSPGEVFVLGLSNEDFPARPERGLLHRDSLKRQADPHDESVCLLARLLRRAERLWLSYPAATVENEAQPAPPLNDLRDLCGRSEPPGHDVRERPTSSAELAVADPNHGLRDGSVRGAIKYAALVIREVASPDPTAYDGKVNRKLLDPVPGADRRGELAVTKLEQYLTCPRRYYFAHLLGLERFPEVRDEAEADVVGIVTHRALELFFAGSRKEGRRPLEPWSDGPLGEGNWEKACGRMLECAARAFVGQGIIEPNASPPPLEQMRTGLVNASAALDAQREELIRGLDDPDAKAPYGILKGALVIQRELIRTLPTEIEFSFGGDNGNPLELGDLRLTGRVDRLDRDENFGRLAIYDYKTGSGKTGINDPPDNLRNLQLPLYALAARRLYDRDGAMGLRAAEIRLHENYRNLPPDDPTQNRPLEGAVQEKVAVGKPNRAWVVSDEFTQKMLEFVEVAVQELWDGIVNGRFHPPPEIKDETCKYCDFRPACGEDFQARKLCRLPGEGGGADG
ncbi:MAG: PD-(D/E)XK nuclease family protein [bacterium]|nr:PD-(D/E)XK nuclease family protein [bacterium]